MRRHPGRSTFLFLSGEVGDTLGASESSFLRSGVKRVQAIVKGGCQQCRGGRRSCSTNGLPSFDETLMPSLQCSLMSKYWNTKTLLGAKMAKVLAL